MAVYGDSPLDHFRLPLNPILHTAWLENHALTLKSNTAKCYFCEKSSCLHTFLKFCSELRKISVKFKTILISMLKAFFKSKSYCMANLPGVHLWFRSHCTFECYTLSGYRASTISHQTAPIPPPSLFGSITFTHLEENSSMVKLPYLC